MHDIIVQYVIPFAKQFNNTKMPVVINIQDFQVQGIGSELIPLGMDEIIVNGVGEFKFAVFASVERGPLVFGGYVKRLPMIKGFYTVHVLN